MSFLFSLQSGRMFFRQTLTNHLHLSSFSHFLNFSSHLFGPIIWVFGWGFSSVGWISGLSEMVLLQGAGSCPTHSTAYQPHIQLSMKEGWKDGGIIGRSESERDQASEAQRMEGCSDREQRGMGSWWEEGVERFGWRMEGWSRGVYPLRGPVAESQAVRRWMGAEAIPSLSSSLSLSFLVSFAPPVSLTIAFLVDSWASFSLSLLSLFTLSFLPQSAGWQANWGHDGRCPPRVRQHFLSVPEARSGSIRGKPALASFSVCEVQLLCSVTPLTTPISAALGLCKLELTTRPCLLKICTLAMPQHLTTFQLCDFSLFLFVTRSKIEIWDHKQTKNVHIRTSRPVRKYSLSMNTQYENAFTINIFLYLYTSLNNPFENK